MTDNSDTWGLFTDEAERYDATVEWVLPCYRQMHEMLAKIAIDSCSAWHEASGEGALALDIGSGSGAEAIPLLTEIPSLRIVGLDRSAPMNALFTKRANSADVESGRFRLVEKDIFHPDVKKSVRQMASESFDRQSFSLVISVLTLHHFSMSQKKDVFAMVYDLLEPGGVFLLGDLFSYDPESHQLEKRISEWETEWITRNFEQGAMAAREGGNFLKAKELFDLKRKWLCHYQDEHHLDSVLSQSSTLKKLGFGQIANPFRFWHTGLIVAVK